MQGTWCVEELEGAIAGFLPQLGRSLLFMGHLSTLRFLRWGAEAAQPVLVSQVRHAPL